MPSFPENFGQLNCGITICQETSIHRGREGKGTKITNKKLNHIFINEKRKHTKLQ